MNGASDEGAEGTRGVLRKERGRRDSFRVSEMPRKHVWGEAFIRDTAGGKKCTSSSDARGTEWLTPLRTGSEGAL